MLHVCMRICTRIQHARNVNTDLKQRRADGASSTARAVAVAAAEDKTGSAAPLAKPRVVDQNTGLGQWEAVEVNTETTEDAQLEHERIEAMRQRLEAKSQKRRQEKQVEFGSKEAGPLVDHPTAQPATFKKTKLGDRRNVRRKKTSDNEED